MSYMTSLPKNPTRDQLIAWLQQTGGCGLILADFSTRCPRRSGPVNPSTDYPGLVGFPGENGYCTCSGCEHFLGLDWNNYVCKHPGARAIAARALAERIRQWEESQARTAQLEPQVEATAAEPQPPSKQQQAQMALF
jgi:hypothetical protein